MEHPQLLAEGLAELTARRRELGHDRVAGHFGLRFEGRGTASPDAYYFYEAKARLNRPDCVRGDQGFLLAASYFQDSGGFDESLPYLEDVRLAARIGRTGVWVNLPGVLTTSARRFEAEGLGRRQLFNAMLCNFDRIGLHGYLAAAPDAYRQRSGARPLRLTPFLRLARQALGAERRPAQARYWLRTGRFIAANAWQLAFALDCRLNRRRGWRPGEGPRVWLERYERGWHRVLESLPCAMATALLTAGGLYGILAWARLRESRPAKDASRGADGLGSA